MAQETRTSTFLLRGGLNLVTPAVAIPQGQCINAKNYEAEVSGYKRVPGMERTDGRPAPSEASYWVLNHDAGVAAVTIGDRITGATSTATGTVLLAPVVQSGSVGTGDAAGYFLLTDVTGTFLNNEALQVLAATAATADGTQVERGADNDDDDRTWHQAAIEARRASILQVPGSGAVRGVGLYKGDRYAVRDNVAGTGAELFKATPGGWAAQDLGLLLEFNTSTAKFNEGATLTGALSGATGVIKRAVLNEGSWVSAGAGFLVFASVTGTFQAAETITDDGTLAGSAKVTGAQTANTLPAGGRYLFESHNFYGVANREMMYAVSGAGRAFEWDGAILSPIRTGVAEALDKPTHLAIYQQHLFLGYPGGSLMISEPGDPLQYSTTRGAGEVGFGSDFADLINNFQTALIVIGTSKIGFITGSSTADFQLEVINEDGGGKTYSAQSVGQLLYMDDQGVREIEATQRFGNFRANSITAQIQPLFEAKRRAGASPVASLRVRSRDLYRLFFDDRTVLSIYMGRKMPEPMTFDYPFQVICAASGDDADGYEILLAGGEDGHFYELDRGTSFDGQEVTAFIQFPFNSLGSPNLNKTFYKTRTQVIGTARTTLSVSAEFSYGDPDLPPSDEQFFDVSGGGGFWDQAVWNQFVWSSEVVGRAEAYFDGFGTNVSIAIMSDAAFEEPHTLSSMTLHYNDRGLE